MNQNTRGSSPPYHAHAKINLGLEILAKRPDSFHEVATVMQTIELHDVLTFSISDDLNLSTNLSELNTSDNLVLAAARELRAAGGTEQGASIKLDKRIPLAAGLGGGSSDAACALRALSALWKLDLSPEDLATIATRLGSDVPFFLHGGTALARGRGEIITPLPPLRPYRVLLVCPRVQIPDKTRLLYSKITPTRYSDGKVISRLAATLQRGQEIDLKAITNVFQPILLEENPIVRACYDRFRLASRRPVLLSGAGPSLFTLTRDGDEASAIAEAMRELDADVFLTHTIGI